MDKRKQSWGLATAKVDEDKGSSRFPNPEKGWMVPLLERALSIGSVCWDSAYYGSWRWGHDTALGSETIRAVGYCPEWKAESLTPSNILSVHGLDSVCGLPELATGSMPDRLIWAFRGWGVRDDAYALAQSDDASCGLRVEAEFVHGMRHVRNSGLATRMPRNSPS